MIELQNMPWVPVSFVSKWTLAKAMLLGKNAVGYDRMFNRRKMTGYWYRGILYVVSDEILSGKGEV